MTKTSTHQKLLQASEEMKAKIKCELSQYRGSLIARVSIPDVAGMLPTFVATVDHKLSASKKDIVPWLRQAFEEMLEEMEISQE